MSPPSRITTAERRAPRRTWHSRSRSRRRSPRAQTRRRAVERGTEPARELLRRTRSPVVEEEDAWLLPGHVLMDGDDIDVRLAERLQHGLELVLEHREIAVHDGVVV